MMSIDMTSGENVQVHFAVRSKLQMAIKCKNIINILYLLLWVYFRCSGRLDDLLANKFILWLGQTFLSNFIWP